MKMADYLNPYRLSKADKEPTFPIEFPYTNAHPSLVNYHRFDNVPRPAHPIDIWLEYSNKEYFALLNELGVPHA